MGSNIGVGNTNAPHKPNQQMAGAMSHQGAPTMGDNQYAPQKFVRLVGCRDRKAADAAGDQALALAHSAIQPRIRR